MASRCCSSGTPALTSQVRQARRLPRLTLYTGTDCQLCDVAKSVLDDVARDVPFELVEYNIRDNSLEGVKQWRRAYQYGEMTPAFVRASALIWPTSTDIPVLHLEDKGAFGWRESAEEKHA